MQLRILRELFIKIILVISIFISLSASISSDIKKNYICLFDNKTKTYSFFDLKNKKINKLKINSLYNIDSYFLNSNNDDIAVSLEFINNKTCSVGDMYIKLFNLKNGSLYKSIKYDENLGKLEFDKKNIYSLSKTTLKVLDFNNKIKNIIYLSKYNKQLPKFDTNLLKPQKKGNIEISIMRENIPYEEDFKKNYGQDYLLNKKIDNLVFKIIDDKIIVSNTFNNINILNKDNGILIKSIKLHNKKSFTTHKIRDEFDFNYNIFDISFNRKLDKFFTIYQDNNFCITDIKLKKSVCFDNLEKYDKNYYIKYNENKNYITFYSPESKNPIIIYNINQNSFNIIKNNSLNISSFYFSNDGFKVIFVYTNKKVEIYNFKNKKSNSFYIKN